VVIPSAKITPMKRRDIQKCEEIVAISDPWKTLRERIDFSYYIQLKEAYICAVDNQPVGFVIFKPEPVFARGGYLRAIGVSSSMRGKGIGRMLMTFTEQMTARLSPHLFLCVSSFNQDAQVFYKKLGYAQVGTLTDHIIQNASEYIYWKRMYSTFTL